MSTKSPDRKPNIVLINCDDLGYGDLSCYGSKKHDTPYTDFLAENGLKLNDFYMPSPICSPSRGGMMTGCYPPRIQFGLFDGEEVLFPGQGLGLNPDEYTISRMLKNTGYRTKIVGKWHCGDQNEFLPTKHGFDEYFGIPYSNDMGRMPSRKDNPPLPLLQDESVVQAQPDQSAITERYVEHSVDFIRRNRDEPFFLYLAHMHVHRPLYASPCFQATSRNGDYGACVAAIDWATGVITETLKNEGLLDDTLIIFTSDNGSRNDYGESNGVLRGTKKTNWEGGVRVPLIVFWPNKIPAGLETSEILTAMDILPTLASIVGEELPKDRKIDGVDASDLWLGETSKSPRSTYFYYMHNCLEAVRSGDWKLFVARKPNSKDAVPVDGKPLAVQEAVPVTELYNLRDDPGETKNLYHDYPEIVKRLQTEIEICREDIGDSFTKTGGKNVREIGKVTDPRPLTEYEEDHPYIIAMYDRDEIG